MDNHNPIIRHKFTADPTVIVSDDTVWLYTGHDEAPVGTEEYIMNEWLCFSSQDLIKWEEYPVPLRATDFSWASGGAFASKVIQANGKFYWYVAVSHKEIDGKAIGVAIADHAAGPYTDARGSALITAEILPIPAEEKINLDPTVLVEADGSAYIFWGNQHCFYAGLDKSLTALSSAPGEIVLPNFSEGAHIHYRDGWYYLSYGYGMPEQVAYAMSRSIHGPWEFKGILNDLPVNCETNRPAIIDFKGNSYFFYHNGALENGGSHRRSVCIDRFYYNSDGTMQRVVMTAAGI